MLSWNVLISDTNTRRIEPYNVLSHRDLVDSMAKVVRRLSRDREHTEDEKKMIFSEELRKYMMCYFWSKCEWEVLVSDWVRPDYVKAEKIDVYDQVRIHWDHFVDYCWENRKEFTRAKHKSGTERKKINE